MLVTDRPESVTEAAPDTRAWGNGLVTGSPDRVAVEGGCFPCGVDAGAMCRDVAEYGGSGRLCAACGARFRCEFAGGF